MDQSHHNASTKAGLRSFLRAIYVHCFFDELIFIYSFYAVMFSDRGLNALQISVLFAVWSAVGFLLEIPSGAVADKYPRKHVLIFAQFGKLACCVCWLVFPGFWGFLAGFACWGAKSAFTSGAFEALVFDELKHYGAQSDYARMIGRMRSLETIAVLLADLSAAAMVHRSYPCLLIASLVSVSISIVALFFIQPAKRAKVTSDRPYFTLLREGVREAVRNQVARRLILFLSFALIFGALEEYWTLFFINAGVPRPAVGLLCAVLTAAYVLASAVAHRFKGLPDRILYAAYLAAGCFVLAAAYLMRPISVIGIALFCFISAVLGIVFESRLQDAITGDARATTLSVRGFLSEIAALHIFLAFGAIASGTGYRGGFMVFGALIALVGVLYLAFARTTVATSPKT